MRTEPGAALIEAARGCFAETGYDRTTVAAILDRAGMARGGLYHYFPDGKREIFAAVFASMNEEFHRRRDSLEQIASPFDRILAGARVFLELCTTDEFPRIVLTDAPQLIPGQSERGSTFALLQQQLGAAVEAGEIVPVDIESTAMALYGAIRGAGEWVMAADDRGAAAITAMGSLELLAAGLRPPS